jgi:GDPmannose 4,6-dehydratase
MRPEELKYLKGDASKANSVLGWQPDYTFDTMMDEMIEHWMAVL